MAVVFETLFSRATFFNGRVSVMVSNDGNFSLALNLATEIHLLILFIKVINVFKSTHNLVATKTPNVF